MPETSDPDIDGEAAGASEQLFFGLPNVYVARGSHIAHFYSGEEEQFSVMVPYIQAGLNAGDQCLLLAEAEAFPVFRERLRELGVDIDEALASRQLVMAVGTFDTNEMSATLDAIIDQAQRAHRDVIRIANDTGWAIEDAPTAERMLEWETYIDEYVGSRANFITLCQYDYARMGGSAVMCALRTHHFSIIADIVQENPFYQPAVEVLEELN